MSTKETPNPPKTRGGQPGNHNARTHSFYSRELTTEQQEALDAAHGVQDLDQEIALLRLKILAIANSPNENYPAFLMALSLLTKMLTVDLEFKRLSAEQESRRAYRAELEERAMAQQLASPERVSDLIKRFRQMHDEEREKQAAQDPVDQQ